MKILVAFRPPAQQHKALIEIAKLPEGRIIVATKSKYGRWLCYISYIQIRLNVGQKEIWII